MSAFTIPCSEELDTIVGTSTNCSAFCGGRPVELCQARFHHLQHRSIESLDQLVPDATMLLHLPLRPRLQQCRWPLSPGGPAIIRGKFIVLGRSHPGAGDFLLAPWGVVRRAHLGVRMVDHRSQHRSNRLLLVSPPRAQTAFAATRLQMRGQP